MNNIHDTSFLRTLLVRGQKANVVRTGLNELPQPQLETHSSPILPCLCLLWIKDEPFNIQVHKEQLINHTQTPAVRETDRLCTTRVLHTAIFPSIVSSMQP